MKRITMLVESCLLLLNCHSVVPVQQVQEHPQSTGKNVVEGDGWVQTQWQWHAVAKVLQEVANFKQSCGALQDLVSPYVHIDPVHVQLSFSLS